jgi:hypothetical protein
MRCPWVSQWSNATVVKPYRNGAACEPRLCTPTWLTSNDTDDFHPESIDTGGTGVDGHSIIIRASENVFTNDPVNGGIGARIACGVVVTGS